MKLARSIFCASAMGLAVSAAFANDYSAQDYHDEYYAEERGLSTGPVPPSVDEGGVARNPSVLNDTPDVLIVEEQVVVADPLPQESVNAPQESVNAMFDRLDENNDGRIGAQEAKNEPIVDRRFEQADRNNTNALDREELSNALSAAPAPSADALFARYDVNGDGMISAQEAGADPELQRWFAAADSDGSGALTRGEFESAVQMAASEHRERARQG